MNTHELAEELLTGPKREITVSVDTSTDKDNAASRCFSDDFIGFQFEGDGAVTLLFECGYMNDE